MRKNSFGIIFFVLFIIEFLFAAKVPVIIERDLKGKNINSAELNKKGPVIVWFFNTCCGLKDRQLESLKKLYSQYAEKGLSIISISEDGVGRMAKTKKIVTIKKIEFPVIMDKSSNLMKKFNAFAVPAIYLIDKNGDIIYSKSGYLNGDEKKLENSVADIFSNQSE